jgi:hypothetical protein
VSWIFFRAASISDALVVLSRVAGAIPRLPSLIATRIFAEDVAGSLALLIVLLVLEALDERKSIWERLRTLPIYARWAFYYALIFSLILMGQWGLRQFVYMQF